MFDAEQLLRYIRSHGISLSAVARETGIPYSSLYASLKSRPSRDLRINEAVKICQFVGAKLDDFIREAC